MLKYIHGIDYVVLHLCTFWLVRFINQRALYNHALSVVMQHRRWRCLCTPPPDMHTYPPYTHIKYFSGL